MRLSGVLDHVGKRLGKAVRKQKQRRYSNLFNCLFFDNLSKISDLIPKVVKIIKIYVLFQLLQNFRVIS